MTPQPRTRIWRRGERATAFSVEEMPDHRGVGELGLEVGDGGGGAAGVHVGDDHGGTLGGEAAGAG
ncbi:MAG: hypothetical protein EBZ45_03385, partial [Actinobacteria bacterium]|nr:hypothetical protein [Actinomycetota bacterium]